MATRRNQRLGLNFEDKAMIRGVQKAGRVFLMKFAESVKDRAKRRVPVKSGWLRDHIEIKERKRRGKDEKMITLSTNTRGKPARKSDLNYREEGRKRKDIETVGYGYGADVEMGRPGGKYESTPYIRPSLSEALPEVPKLMQEEAETVAAEMETKRTKQRDTKGRFL